MLLSSGIMCPENESNLENMYDKQLTKLSNAGMYSIVSDFNIIS
jgi:hypothetical protein